MTRILAGKCISFNELEIIYEERNTHVKIYVNSNVILKGEIVHGIYKTKAKFRYKSKLESIRAYKRYRKILC
ncbi:hypothetical protein BBO01nite_30690 [Brevibacillus borstelensis]|nr:hypothetical protein BBO01nite_30690 [Brevibacillus borstelensis]